MNYGRWAYLKTPAYGLRQRLTAAMIRHRVVVDVGCWTNYLAPYLSTDAFYAAVDPLIPSSTTISRHGEHCHQQYHACDVEAVKLRLPRERYTLVLLGFDFTPGPKLEELIRGANQVILEHAPEHGPSHSYVAAVQALLPPPETVIDFTIVQTPLPQEGYLPYPLRRFYDFRRSAAG
jgi:hypothetical protein